MNESKTILVIILVAVLLLYITGIVYLLVRYVIPGNQNQTSNMNNNQIQPIVVPAVSVIDMPACEIKSPQTEFFKQSIDHAEKVLMGKVYLDAYKYGSAVDLTKLDDDTKKAIVVSMKYMMIDPISSRNIEERFRLIRDQENVPLWFVILHEAINKLIPTENVISKLSDEALLAEVEKRKLNQPIYNNSEGATIIPINRVA